MYINIYIFQFYKTHLIKDIFLNSKMLLSGECILLGFCLIKTKIWSDGHKTLGMSQLSGLGQTVL